MGGLKMRMAVVAIGHHNLYVHSLKALIETLSPAVNLVGIGMNVGEGMRLLDECETDLVLVDIRSGRAGVDVVKKLIPLYPSVKVVALASSPTAVDVVASLRAGARGYLTKEIDPEELMAALSAVISGEVVLAPSAASLLLDTSSSAMALTDEEIHILELLAAGIDLADAAREVAVSESTLKRSIRAIQEKLQVANRTQAVVVAAKRGLI